jgi:hypothetical protein
LISTGAGDQAIILAKRCSVTPLKMFAFVVVDAGNPWGNCISSDQDDKEMLASYWYSKTWDEKITNPNTQFLLCLKAYINKTGKCAGLTSYCGEPLLLSALHLKKSVPEQSGAWLEEAYLPDLEACSSAKKKRYSHSHKTCGRTNRNYHKVMQAVLQGVHAAQLRQFCIHVFLVLVCPSVLTMNLPAPGADSACPPGMLTCHSVLLSLLKKSGKVFVTLFPRFPPPWPTLLRHQVFNVIKIATSLVVCFLQR